MKSLHRTEQTKGFALVVTLTLMILLTILAVGLLSLSSISLRASNQTAALAEARQNARMAMMLALGELQKHAGPDQRSTGAADLAGTTTGDTLAAGGSPANNASINGVNKGLSQVQSGTRYWTGVWRNNLMTATAGTEIYTKTPSPKFVQWLISGNETSDTTLYTPATGDCSVGGSGSVSDSKKAVVLVGKNTTGAPATDSLARYVAAPLITIRKTDGATQRETGRYGWWIGDEGVKARINTPKTVVNNTSYASLTAQRRGWETVAGFSSYPTPDSPNHGNLPKAVTLGETRLLGVDSSSGGSTPQQAAFHSATADSRGVIVDSYNGGTKIDLTALLSGGLPSTNPIPAIPNYPIKNTNIIPRVAASRIIAPKWDAMKEFYDRSKGLENGALIVKAATNNTSGSIAPLVTDIRILLGMKFAPGTSGSGYKCTGCGKIAIALANPYSRPLKWKTDMEVQLLDITPPGNSPARVYNLGDNAPFIDRNKPAVFNNMFFRIRAGELAPGEAKAYTLSGYTLRAIGTGMTRAVADLAPFDSSMPFDFTRCVELDASGVYTSFPLLDVRESWQTTLMALELNLAGSRAGTPPLRRIERFEMDNGYFPDNYRNRTWVYPTDYQSRTKPIPLMCFNFQLSQPGVDYLNLMPNGYAWGQRGSTFRTFTDFNLQATRFGKPIASYNPPPYFMESNNGFAQLPDTPPGGDTGIAFTKNLATTMAWGRAFNGAKNTILFSVPDRVDSLAQFQHADLTGDDIAASIGHQPGNAFANSYAPPFVKRNLVVQPRVDYEIIGSPNPTGVLNYQTNAMGIQNTPQTPRNYYDISYLLNAAIWDSYFLSTVRYGGGSVPENPSMIVVNGDTSSSALTDPVQCATKLMIDGAFNVNCTDKNAWKAFLASSKHFATRADSAAGTANAAFPRTLEQTTAAANPPTGTAADSFAGFRRLSDIELDALATEMVRQVRLRGPFISLAQFVNRSLGDLRRQPVQTRSGPLQLAIDESGCTINYAGNKKVFPGVNVNIDRVNLSEKYNGPAPDWMAPTPADRSPMPTPPFRIGLPPARITTMVRSPASLLTARCSTPRRTNRAIVPPVSPAG